MSNVDQYLQFNSVNGSQSEGQEPSMLLESFNKLCLSTGGRDDAQDQGINASTTTSPTSMNGSNRSPPILCSSESQISSFTSDNIPIVQVKNEDNSSSRSVEDNLQGVEVESDGQKVPQSYAVRNNLKIPFPDEPILDVMNFNDLNLDKTFSIHTALAPPKRMGYFSCHINIDGKTQSYHSDKSSLRYLYYYPYRRLNLNLLNGFNPDVTWGRVPPGEMHLLRWFSENAFDCYNNEDSEHDDNIDFICYTRMLKSIMNAPYNFRDDWICIAIKVRGSIILDEIDTAKRQFFTDKQSPRQMASSYAGYRFEELLTRRFDGVHRPTHNYGNRDSFYIVSKTKLNSHTLLYCTRADCASNKAQLDKQIEEMEFVQIKTRSENYNISHQARSFFWQKRAIAWWIESMLSNIDQIICGDKNDNLQVTKVSRLNIDRIPKERNKWSPRTCVSFLDLVLTFIKSMVTDELTPYRFYCVPGRAIVCQKINEPAENYLPSWFINGEEPNDE